MFIPLSDVAIGQSRFFAQHSVDFFMKLVDVFRESVARRHMPHLQGKFAHISFQILAAFPAREDVAETVNEIAVLGFIFGSRVHGVVETHGMQEMPRPWPPDRRQHSIVTIEIIFGINGGLACVSTAFFVPSRHLFYTNSLQNLNMVVF